MLTGAGLDLRAHSGHGRGGHKIFGPVLLPAVGSTVRFRVTRFLSGLARGLLRRFRGGGAGVEGGARRGQDVAVPGAFGGLLAQEHEGSADDVEALRAQGQPVGGQLGVTLDVLGDALPGLEVDDAHGAVPVGAGGVLRLASRKAADVLEAVDAPGDRDRDGVAALHRYPQAGPMADRGAEDTQGDVDVGAHGLFDVGAHA